MDTFLYIVIAIAILVYQIYNDKKKKEQRNNAVNRPSVNRPPVQRIDPNEELHRDLAQMFGSFAMRDHLEDDSEFNEQQDVDFDEIDNRVEQQDSLLQQQDSLLQQHDNLLQQHDNLLKQHDFAAHSYIAEKSQKDKPAETLGNHAYNVAVPVNKTDAETTQLLQEIYDSPEISNFGIGQEPYNELNNKVKSFDPRLFILYSEIAQPKYRD